MHRSLGGDRCQGWWRAEKETVTPSGLIHSTCSFQKQLLFVFPARQRTTLLCSAELCLRGWRRGPVTGQEKPMARAAALAPGQADPGHPGPETSPPAPHSIPHPAPASIPVGPAAHLQTRAALWVLTPGVPSHGSAGHRDQTAPREPGTLPHSSY